MFDNLTDRLQGAFRTLAGNDKLSHENIEDAIREVRKSLLEADVSLKVVKIFIRGVQVPIKISAPASAKALAIAQP